MTELESLRAELLVEREKVRRLTEEVRSLNHLIGDAKERASELAGDVAALVKWTTDPATGSVKYTDGEFRRLQRLLPYSTPTPSQSPAGKDRGRGP